MNRLDFIIHKSTKEEMEMRKQRLLEEERIQYIIDHKKELKENAEALRLYEARTAMNNVRGNAEVYPGAVIPLTRPRRSREEPPSSRDNIRIIEG